jgi:hypothetical protein
MCTAVDITSSAAELLCITIPYHLTTLTLMHDFALAVLSRNGHPEIPVHHGVQPWRYGGVQASLPLCLQAVALDPRYGLRKSREVVVGGAAGQLVLCSKVHTRSMQRSHTPQQTGMGLS